jgi:hypothetical protein
MTSRPRIKALAIERCPVTRQLLGQTSSNAGLYAPTANDTPLRPWLALNGAAGPIGSGELACPAWALTELAPAASTVRGLEAQGVTEGDVGHAALLLASPDPGPSSRAQTIDTLWDFPMELPLVSGFRVLGMGPGAGTRPSAGRATHCSSGAIWADLTRSPSRRPGTARRR